MLYDPCGLSSCFVCNNNNTESSLTQKQPETANLAKMGKTTKYPFGERMTIN